jgi:hypothetical protein
MEKNQAPQFTLKSLIYFDLRFAELELIVLSISHN